MVRRRRHASRRAAGNNRGRGDTTACGAEPAEVIRASQPEDTAAGKPGSAVRRVFLAQFISVTGDKLFAIALSWWIVGRDDLPDREFVLGLLLAASTLPIALSGPLLGPLIDRHSKRACMIAADLGRLVLMTALAYCIHEDRLNLPLLFALCIPIFALEPLFDSSVSASLSSLSRNSAMLAQLVALESAIPNLGAVMGALSGSLALAIWSTETAFWFNAATFLFSLLLVLGIPALRTPVESESPDGTDKGYGFLKDHPAATRLMICFGLANFFVAPLFFYLPLLARDVLNTDGSGLARLELAFAAGNLLVFAYFFLRPKQYFRVRWLRFLLVALSGVFYFVLGHTVLVPLMLSALFTWGCSVAFVTYLAISSFQRTIPDEFKGRFFAMLTSICTIAVPLSFACVGFLSTRLSLQDLILGNGVGVIAISLAFLAIPDESRTGFKMPQSE